MKRRERNVGTYCFSLLMASSLFSFFLEKQKLLSASFTKQKEPIATKENYHL
jgi:hypothetical protein